MACLPIRCEAPLQRAAGRTVQTFGCEMRVRSSSCISCRQGISSFVGASSVQPLRVAHKTRKNVFATSRGCAGQSLKCNAFLPGLHPMMPLAFLSPQAFILEGIFGMIALAIGAAFSFAFGGVLMAGAATTIALALAFGGLLWVGFFLTVALPVMLAVMLGVGAVGAFVLYRLTQPDESKKMQENARKQMLEFEKRFGKNAGAAGFRKGQVIDVKVESELEQEVLNRKKEVEQDLSDFDRRLRGRFFD